MNAIKELQKIDKRLADARLDLRTIDDEQCRALAEVKTAEAGLADHFAQENVDELHPAGPATTIWPLPVTAPSNRGSNDARGSSA